jgi:hypothetical protein
VRQTILVAGERERAMRSTAAHVATDLVLLRGAASSGSCD